MVRSLKNSPFSIIVGIGNKARSSVDVKGVGRAETAFLQEQDTWMENEIGGSPMLWAMRKRLIKG